MKKIIKYLQKKIEDWKDKRDGLKALKKHKQKPNFVDRKTLLKELDLSEEDLK